MPKTKKSTELQRFIVAFSGGKDSIGCFLHLLDLGIPSNMIELHHHEVDGREGSVLMDWPITPAYCKAFAKAFNVPIYFSWKVGGFEAEMLKENIRSAPTKFELPDGSITQAGGIHGKIGTRRKFPQITPNLSQRWCSSALKIDVGAIVLKNQDRFRGVKTVVVSGERAEEGLTPGKFKAYLSGDLEDDKIKGRASYAEFEPDRSDLREGIKYQRHIDHWRPIKNWPVKQVWDIIKKHKVRVHPAYYLGFSRCSCQFCIFGNEHQFATAFKISPERGKKLVNYENDFGATMKRKENLESLVARGTPYAAYTPKLAKLATSTKYNLNIIIDDWKLPPGAYGSSCGPT